MLGSLGGKPEAAMSIGKTRGFLYGLARLLGDVNAAKKGKVGKRIERRPAGISDHIWTIQEIVSLVD